VTFAVPLAAAGVVTGTLMVEPRQKDGPRRCAGVTSGHRNSLKSPCFAQWAGLREFVKSAQSTEIHPLGKRTPPPDPRLRGDPLRRGRWCGHRGRPCWAVQGRLTTNNVALNSRVPQQCRPQQQHAEVQRDADVVSKAWISVRCPRSPFDSNTSVRQRAKPGCKPLTSHPLPETLPRKV
jgi:hypothetical protein